MLIRCFLCQEFWGSILDMSKTAGGNEFQVKNPRKEKLGLCHVSFNTLWSDLSLSQPFMPHTGCQKGLP